MGPLYSIVCLGGHGRLARGQGPSTLSYDSR